MKTTTSWFKKAVALAAFAFAAAFGLTAEAATVAKIGDAAYETLQAACDAVAAGETVLLLADNEEDVNVEAKVFTFDANGHSFTGTITPASYVAYANSDGTTTYGPSGMPVRCDATFYATLPEAFSAVSDNENLPSVVVVYQNLSNVMVTNYAGRYATLDLNGCKLTGISTSAKYALKNDGVLTITGGGEIVGNNNRAAVYNCGTLTFDGNGTVTGKASKNAVQNYNDGVMTVNDTWHIVTSATYPLSNSGTLTVNGGTIEMTGSNAYQGSYFVTASSQATINGGTFKSTSGKAIVNSSLYDGTVVKGGQFCSDVTDYCAAGLCTKFNPESGYWEVDELEDAQIVAKIGDDGFATLQGAILAAQENDTVELVKDIEAASVQVANKDSFTIDFGDCWLTLTNHITLAASGSLYLSSSVVTLKATGTGGVRTAGYCPCAIIQSGGTLTVLSGNYSASDEGTLSNIGTLYLSGAAAVSISGGTFTGADWAVYRSGNSPTVQISGGTFTGGSGEIGSPYASTARISGGWFKHVVSADYCADGYIPDATPVENYYTVKEGTVTEDNATIVVTYPSGDETVTTNYYMSFVQAATDISAQSAAVKSNAVLRIVGDVVSDVASTIYYATFVVEPGATCTANGSLTLNDVTLVNRGMLNVGMLTSSSTYKMFVVNEGSMSVGGTWTMSANSVVTNATGATLTITGSAKISAGTADKTGVQTKNPVSFVNNGDVVVDGGTLTVNALSGYASTFSVEACKPVPVNNGSITGTDNGGKLVANYAFTGTTPISANTYTWTDGSWTATGSVKNLTTQKLYDSLTTAYTELTDDETTLQLQADVYCMLDANAHNVTIDLNGKSWTANYTRYSGKGQNLTVYGGVSVTVDDSTATTPPALDADGNLVYASGKMSVAHGNGTVRVLADGAFELKGGLVEMTYASASEAAIDVDMGTAYGYVGSTNASIVISGGCVKGSWYGILLCGPNSAAETNAATSVKLEVSAGIVMGGKVAISGLGTCNNTEIAVSGGLVYSPELGIYHPQAGTLTVAGGEVKGGTGISMKGGSIVVSGGAITGTDAAVEPASPTTSGTCLTGDALYIEDNYDGRTVYADVSGGTLTSSNAYALAARFANATQGAEVTITGGQFKGATGKAALYANDSFEGSIFATAGHYSSKPAADYIADGYEAIENTDPATSETYPWTIGAAVSYVAEVLEISGATTNVVGQYETLAAAVAAAKNNETIVMIDDCDITFSGSEYIRIASGRKITLDLNGKTIISATTAMGASYLICNYGDLTITDTADKDKDGNFVGTIFHGANPTWIYEGGDDYSGSYNSTVVACEANGKLTINGGNIEMASAGSAAYALEIHSHDSKKSTSTAIVINDGYIYAPRNAIRAYESTGSSGSCDLTVNGGRIYGGYAGLLIHAPNQTADDAPVCNFTVTGGTIGGGTYAFYDYSDGQLLTGNTYNFSGGVFAKSIWSYGANFNITGGEYWYSVRTYKDRYGENEISVSGGCFDYYFKVYRNNQTADLKSISGGLYAYKQLWAGTDSEWNLSDYVVDGYEVTANADPLTSEYYPWAVAVAARAAQVVSSDGTTTNKFATLQAAFDAVKAGETIEVLANNSETITVTNTCAFTFKSNGYTLGSAPSVPSGYMFKVNGDGTCNYGKTVAQIGETKYLSLADAVAAVPAAGATATTIKMIANETMEEEATVSIVNKYIVLDLNDKTISGSGDAKTKNFYLIDIGSGATVIIDDSSEKADGVITMTPTAVDSGYGKESCTVYNCGGTLTLRGGKVVNAATVGLAYAINNSSNAWADPIVSTFLMEGGTVSAPSGDAALRVYINAGQQISENYVNISGGTILDKGIFVDSISYQKLSTNMICVVNVTGGTVNGLIDLKLRNEAVTMNISGGTFGNSDLRVRNYKAESLIDELTKPAMNITGGTFSFADGGSFKALDWNEGSAKPFSVSGGTFSIDPTDYVVAGRVANKVSILGVDWWVVGEIVDTGDNTTAVVVVDHTSTPDVKDVPESMPKAVVDQFEQNTTVTGVKLVETNETVTTSGTQAVVDKARLEGTAAFRDNLKKAANVLVNVDVSVKPTIYVAPAQETKAGEIAFTLTPVATVTVDEGGEDKTEEVEVTNEMIDTLQDIVVTVYTGFKPEQAFHTADDGTVIDTFTGDEIAYDETTGNASVTIHHFSSLTFTQKPAVASVNGTPYATLAAAFAAAEDDETVTLLTNVVLDACIVVSNDVTLDIGAYNVTATDSFATGTTKDALFAVRYGGDLTVNGTTGAITSGAHAAAIKLTEKGETFESERAKLTVNGGTITGSYYAIVGNGDRPGTDIVINGGMLTATYPNDNLGIFNPQGDSTVTVNGGTIIGYATAIEMRGGQLTVNGGTLTATASEYSCAGAGDGTTTVGAAVAVVQHTTGNAVGAVVNGGTLTGKRALSEANPASGSAVVTLAVSNGVFNGTVAAADVTKYISGGTFSEAVAQEQCVDWFKPVDNGDGTYGVAEQAVFLQNLHGATRYPWNGKVDVTFQLQAARDVKLFVAAFDASSNRVAMTKADLVAPTAAEINCATGFVGTATAVDTWANYHLVWDSAQSVPSNKLEGVSFKVFAR